MSDASRGSGAGGGSSLRELARRLSVASTGPMSNLQDQLDWAEELLADGAIGEGRLLLASTLLQSGLSPRRAAAYDRPEWAGSSPSTMSPTAAAPAGNTVDLAISELRTLARTAGSSIAAGVARGDVRTTFSPGLHPVAVLSRSAPRPGALPLGAMMNDLSHWLQTPVPGREEDEHASALIDQLLGFAGLHAMPPPSAAAPVGLMVEFKALDSLRGFLRASSDLLYAPLGSIRLFHATARLDSAGLGPYFSNVGQIVRRSADLFELADVAARAAASGDDADLMQAWAALMSRGLTGGALEEVVDDLADRRAGFALHIILERTLQSPTARFDLSMVMRLRDAALDNLDYPLALRAQRSIVDVKGGDLFERRILGIIEASAGRYLAAQESFAACLVRAPEDEDLMMRWKAARERKFEPFAVTQGFGSPRDRQLYRLRRRRERSSARVPGPVAWWRAAPPT